LLPTFFFVFGIYAIFALLTAWRQRAMPLLQSAKRKPGPRWGALLMPLGVAWLVAHAVPGTPFYNFNLAEALGEGGRGGSEEQVLAYPAGIPRRAHATEVPPLYALLHPQMTTQSLPPEKKTSLFFLRKPQRKVPLRRFHQKVKLSYSLAMKMPGR
jgi:hypothetical protein